MKNYLVNLGQNARRAVTSCSVVLLSAVVHAQNEGQQVLSAADQGLRSLETTLVSLLKGLIGLGALITLAMLVFKLLKKDREAAESVAWWVGGFTIAFVLISVVQRIVFGGI